MSQLVILMEEKRQLYEKLEAIEEAIVSRILKNPRWVPKIYNLEIDNSVKLLSPRDMALRRIEAGKLVDEYHRVLEMLKNLPEVHEELNFEDELKKAEEGSLNSPDESLKYQLFTDAKGLRRLCSDFTESALDDLNQYPPQENYGQLVYLEPFYTQLKQEDPDNCPSTYREYLVQFEKYATNQKELMQYLIKTYNRVMAIGKYYSWPEPNINGTQASSDTSSANSNPLHCDACNKTFAKETIFQHHLTGRKHKNAILNSVNYIPEILKLHKSLQPVFDATIENINRKSGMSIADRQLEIDMLIKERDMEDEYVTDEDNEVLNEDLKNDLQAPLLGSDGTPIPRWLFRLQGLRNWYKCEICSNMKLQGRKNFEKHFDDSKDSKHANALRKLGVTDLAKFKGITTVGEVRRLQKVLKRNQASALAADAEVEDEDGNVMSERMYNDLKKQGLL